MELENLQEHLKTVETSLAFPLRQHEDDDFGREVNTAIATLVGHGLNDQMIELLIMREIVKKSDCDSFWLGSSAGEEAQIATQSRLAEIDQNLSQLADQAGLNDAVRNTLNIPATDLSR